MLDYVDIFLVCFAGLEQLLSFTAGKYPKSTVQLIMFLFYRLYVFVMYVDTPTPNIDTGDIKAGTSYSLGIGSRV